MLNSYFFIPADKEKFLLKKNEINADIFIIDFEDSVSKNKKNLAFENGIRTSFTDNTFFRIPFLESCYSKEQLLLLTEKCKGRIVLPKIETEKDLVSILNIIGSVKGLEIILLIETPKIFIELKEILNKYGQNIIAIGFGSHDFCSITGIKHDMKYLKHFKLDLSLIAKAFSVLFIDGVDLNIRNLKQFKKECLFAYEIGCDGKFMIHPNQLKVANEIDFLPLDEIKKLKEIHKKIALIDLNDRDVIEIDGVVYEKPHIDKINKLINKKYI